MLSGKHGEAEMIMVYQFRIWDHEKGEMIVPPLKRPAWRIEEIGGQIIDGTGEKVPVDKLDEEGRYNPDA